MRISVDKLRKTLFWMLMLVPFAPVQYLNSVFPIINSLYAYGRIIVILLMVFFIVYSQKCIHVPVILALILCGASFVSSYLGGIDLSRVLSYAIFLIGFTLVIDCGINLNPGVFLKSAALFYGLLIVLNFIFMQIYPDGYTEEYGALYLFGNYNTTIRKLMPGMYGGLLYSFYKKGRIKWWYYILYLLLMAFCIHVWSATAIVGLVVLLIAVTFFMATARQGVFQYKYFFIGSFALTMIFAVLQNFQKFRIIELFITNILKKDMTLSTRTSVWERTISAISEKPIWGYGQVDTVINRARLGAASAHNIFLDELYFGGIIGLIILLLIVVVVGKKIHNEKKSTGNVAVAVTEAIFCSYFIMWSFEPFGDLNSFYIMYGMFTMAYYCGKLSELGIYYHNPFKLRFKLRRRSIT